MRTLIGYIRVGGVAVFTLVFVGILLITALNAGTNIWAAEWGDSWKRNATVAKENSFFCLGVYFALGCSEGTFCLTATYSNAPMQFYALHLQEESIIPTFPILRRAFIAALLYIWHIY